MSQRTPTANFGQLGRSRRGRILIAVVIVVFTLITYFSSSSFNEVTEETQYISITQEQEIALGLQAAPERSMRFGGRDPSSEAQAFVD
ncbi:MAG: hypothetical protein IPL78_36030, partial [Chloroflexi bacterium]|nr:hypothetical protein [Chloroflexota bacterium]